MIISTCNVQGLALVHRALAGMVTENVCVPLWFVVVDIDPAGKPSLSARTGCVVDQTGLLMNAGVHSRVVPAAPNGVGSGNVEATCVEARPSLSEIRHQPGWAMVAVTVTVTGCPGWYTFTIPVAEVAGIGSFPQGGPF